MNVKIKVIPHNQQRYNTCGDWQFQRDGTLLITVSSMKNWRLEMLVAIHELVEVVLCKDRGITQEQVDAFDFQFEKDREPANRCRTCGTSYEDTSPGDDAKAPYHKEHFAAEIVERFLAGELKVDWNNYVDQVKSL